MGAEQQRSALVKAKRHQHAGRFPGQGMATAQPQRTCRDAGAHVQGLTTTSVLGWSGPHTISRVATLQSPVADPCGFTTGQAPTPTSGHVTVPEARAEWGHGKERSMGQRGPEPSGGPRLAGATAELLPQPCSSAEKSQALRVTSRTDCGSPATFAPFTPAGTHWREGSGN